MAHDVPQDLEAVLARVGREREEILARLLDYLRIPSISTDPAHRGDVARCAEHARGLLAEAGLAAEVIDTAGHPLVYGEWTGAPGRPTLLVYGHYDVQPADPLGEWRHPPFEPVVEDGRIVARGATDNKGQHFAHIAAAAATLAELGTLPVNVKFLLEGEEESGGEAIETFVRADGGRRLACDAVVVSDSAMHGPGQPALLYALRGIVYFELRVAGPERDLHSGEYGGAVANPANALARILAELHDARSGRVLVPGFYDDVRPLDDRARRELAAARFDEAAWAAEAGVREPFGEEGFGTLERLWTRPTCDVHGLWGGYQGPGGKTALPALAGAKLSMRLVPDQDPRRIEALVRAHVARVAPPGVRVELDCLHASGPALVDLEGPLVAAALDAIEATWGRAPVRLRGGGSIPIVGTFLDVLRAPVLLIGLGLPDDRLHAPNEKLDLECLFQGIELSARLLVRAARSAS